MLDHVLLYSINTQRSGESRFLICNPACIRWEIFIEISGALADEMSLYRPLAYPPSHPRLRSMDSACFPSFHALLVRLIVLEERFLPESHGTLLEYLCRDITLDTEGISIP